MIDCNHCGWCCQRTPCALAVYMGHSLQGPCQFLVKSEESKYLCGLVEREGHEVRRMVTKQLIMAGEGCSHKFGPHPVSLLKQLLELGLVVGSPQWELAKKGTRQELLQFVQESAEPESLRLALKEFEQFCLEKEGASITAPFLQERS